MIDNWRCEICHKMRPDPNISVLVKPLIFDGQELGSQNIKYCNDNQVCFEGAKKFNYIKQGI